MIYHKTSLNEKLKNLNIAIRAIEHYSMHCDDAELEEILKTRCDLLSEYQEIIISEIEQLQSDYSKYKERPKNNNE